VSTTSHQASDAPTPREAADIQLQLALRVLRRRGLMVVLCVIVLGGGAYAVSTQQTKQYTATASLAFNLNQPSLEVAGLQQQVNNDPQSTLDTNVTLVKFASIAPTTATAVGHGLTAAAVRRSLSISALGDTSIVNVAARAKSPQVAMAIANTYTTQFVQQQHIANYQYYGGALSLAEHQLAALSPLQRNGLAGADLEQRVESLQILSELETGASIARSASLPTTLSSPKPATDAVIGVVLGLLLGLGLAFLAERLDRRIKEPKELEQIYHLPLLGVVPKSSAFSRTSKRRRLLLPPAEAEAFQLIRAHLRYFNVDRDIRVLLVVSASLGDGKSTVARYLTLAAAKVGSRVALIEADLRRPTLARSFDINAGPGLADVILGSHTLADAMQTVQVDSSRVTLDVLVAGRETPPNPGELIESHAMETVLHTLRRGYDLVAIDTPPLHAVSDAFPLLRKVDGVVIVGRLGVNRRDVAQRLRATLVGAGAPLLGVIANGLSGHDVAEYGYGYGYGASGDDKNAAATAPSAAWSSEERTTI